MLSHQNDAAKLILRLLVGGLILFHGVSKIIHGVGWLEAAVGGYGLPGFFAWAVYIGEVLAPLLIITGLFSRIGGLLVLINMIVAVLMMHLGMFFTLSQQGGWALELQAFYGIGGLIIFLQGAGRYSLGGAGGKCN